MLDSARVAAGVAVLVAAIVGCTTQAPTFSPGPTTSLGPTPTSVTSAPPTPAPSPTISLSPSGFPSSVLGLPALTVEGASALLFNGSLDGRFVAIGGYWYQYFLPCPYQPHRPRLADFCGYGVLTDEPMADPFAGPILMRQEFGRLSPALVTESATSFALGGAANPMMVAIVHVGDARLWQCAPGARDTCRQRPVFDRLAWLDREAVDPAQFQPDLATTMSYEQAIAAASAAAGGGEVVVAYPLDATAIQDVDPRFAGMAERIVWYVRVINGSPDADGTAVGTDVLLDDGTGALVATMPLALDPGYQPARLVLDAKWDTGAITTTRPWFGVSAASGTVMAGGVLDTSTTPIVLGSGDYTAHAFIGRSDGTPFDGPTCDLPLTLAAGSDAAYYANFTRERCTWVPGEWPF